MAIDQDSHAVNSYNKNIFPNAQVADLRTWQSLNLTYQQVDLVLSGPPCQGFSVIGNRRHDDSRNHLLIVPVDIAISIGARAVVIENVPGALSGTHKEYWDEAELRLTSAGFATKTIIVDAGMAGLAQMRRRALLIGLRDRSEVPEWNIPPSKPKPLGSILPVPPDSLNHNPRFLPQESRSGQIASRIEPGRKLCNVRGGDSSVHTWDIPEVFGPTSEEEKRLLEALLRLRRQNRPRSWGDADPVSIATLEAATQASCLEIAMNLERKGYVRRTDTTCIDLTHTFNGKFRRLHPLLPTTCVSTKFCEPTHFLHPFENRGFTIREAARLQGFPDSFEFTGPDRAQAKQVGNAVPPPLAKLIAKWLKDAL